MRRLEAAFDWYGRLIARHPLPFLVFPILTTLISCVGLFNFHSQDDIWDIYAPLNALSRVEEHGMNRFEHISATHHYRIQVLVDRKDGGNLMTHEVLNELAAVNRFIVENVTVTDGKRHFNYDQICGIYCNESNALVIGFIQAAMNNPEGSTNFVLTYPTAVALSNSVFLGYSLGGLTTKKVDDMDVVDSFNLFILHYMVDLNLPNGKQLRDNLEDKLLHIFEAATEESEALNFALLSRNRELYEQRQITITAIPFLGLTGAVLTAFMVVTLLDDPLYKSQCVEAVFGVISPGMALITTFGMVWAAGLPFSNILTVVPFLVITIGIDDAFLILAGWRQSNPNADFSTRMGESLAKSGASVSVTSITDVLCFGVGIISNMPVVQLFCIYVSIALAVDFIFQITFFAAIVAYCGKRQMEIEEHVKNGSTESSTNGSISSRGSWRKHLLRNAERIKKVFSSKPSSTTSSQLDLPSSISVEHHGTYLQCFVNALHSLPIQLLIMSIFLGHVVISVYYCTQVNTNFDMENLYLKASPLTPISRRMQRFVLKESFVVNFVVDPMPEFKSQEERDLFHQMIDELENIPKYGMGKKGSNVWTRDYEQTAEYFPMEEEEDIWEPTVVLKNYKLFSLDTKNIHTLFKNGEQVIDAFTFHITYHNMENFNEVEELLTKRREILKRYGKKFHIMSHHPLEKVPTESAASAPINFIQTAVSAIVLMSILVFFFIMDSEAIFSVVLSILSISSGTVGYLYLWSVNLDAVSLISMLMSIGFSVDYSAHVCYHYYTHQPKSGKTRQRATSIMITDGEIYKISEKVDQNIALPLPTVPVVPKQKKEKIDTHERLLHTFYGVGWPVIQSGLSTVLGMIPLFFVDAYVVAVFWKTIILVTALGMFHALFLLPVVFVFMGRFRNLFRQ
ncbi:unnamed protein product [Bursaphelenchus okinawaensis]|uniref:SSD domain-containing protein n=1 Tax=Bursaphelenchus okinawaensis TaxID=465554 RepID=A0A811K1L4_9BILA|nr:unnamed protein product [Bursaphelenchus okinawaensis]CAG9089853.1 unnamed protein product [Bursaphelenchus okinawaensis]